MPFYIVGESYGAHFATGLATVLYENRTQNVINFEGIAFQDAGMIQSTRVLSMIIQHFVWDLLTPN